MNHWSVFSDIFQMQVTVGALLFFLFCGIYFFIVLRQTSAVAGIGYLVVGLSSDLALAWFDSQMGSVGEGDVLNLLSGLNLLIKLCVMLLLLLAASNIMSGGKQPNASYIFVTIVVAMVIIFYFSWISPNGPVVSILRRLLPTLGLGCLFAAYFTKCFREHNLGAIVATINLLGVALLTAIKDEWYTGAIGYVGMGIALILLIIDVQKDKVDQADQQIEKYNQRLKEMIKLSPFPIVITRLSDDSILLANDNFLQLFNLKEKDALEKKFKDFFVDADHRRLLNSHLEKEKIVKDFEILVHSQNSETPFWLSMSANIIDYDYDIAIYSAFQDITDRKKREDILQTQATRDPLTSLYNRRYFEEEVGKRILKKEKEEFCVLMIDADHFKDVNDTYGHKAGDKVLIALSSTAEKALRENDIVARYGGEEFVVYLAKSSLSDAEIVADRLRETISEIEVDSDAGEQIKFTVSIGIASSKDSQNVNELIKMADDALYKAKKAGRNCCKVYNSNTKSKPLKKKKQKEKENVHPAFAKVNDIEISLLGGILPRPEDIHK